VEARSDRPFLALLLQTPGSEPRLGGQAVIEGVMMRDPTGWAVAVRAPDGTIKKRLERRPSFQSTHRWARIPILRGAVALVESLAIGFSALSWSADVFASTQSGKPVRKQETGSGAVSMAAAITFAVALFVVIPAVLTRVALAQVVKGPFALSVAEGLLRVIILVGYILAISRIPEVRRVFEYHGAEHQTIAAYENSEPLVVERISEYSTRHPRCGTSFLLTVMIVTIAVFSVIRGTLPFSLQIAARILLLPLVAGISYELIRAGWALRDRTLAKYLMLPGLALQAITTRQPDSSQIEVAVAALRVLVGENGDRKQSESHNGFVVGSRQENQSLESED